MKKCYMEDIGLLPESILDSPDYEESEPETLRSRSMSNRTVSQQVIQEINPDSFGRLTVKGIGDFDLTDDDTITLAESALKILRKKLPTLKTKKQIDEFADS